MTDASTRSRLPLVAGAVAAIALAALLWVFLGGDEPAAVDATTALEQADAATGDASASEQPTADAEGTTDDPGGEAASDGAVATDGTWSVDTEVVPFSFDDGAGSFVGFRIEEELSNIGATEAVGRTPTVEGSLTLDGTTVTDAGFVGDSRSLTTDDSRRDNRARAALGEDQLAFELTEPIELEVEPTPGTTITTPATGELTINGVTREVTVPLEASLSSSGLLVVTSSFPVQLADHQVDAPSAPIVLSVSDVATVEVQLFLTHGG